MSENDQNLERIRRYINRELLPGIERLRENHATKSRLFYVSAVVSTIVVLVLLGIGGYVFEITTVATLEFVVAVAVVVSYGAALHGIFHLLFVHGVRERYVDEVVAPLVDRVWPGIGYENDEAVSRHEFEQSGVAQVPVDDFDSHDLFEVDVAGARVRFSEIEAGCRARKEGERFARKRTCFLLRGLFFSARLEEPVEGTTVIYPTLRRFSNTDGLPRIETAGVDRSVRLRPAAGWPHVEWSPDGHDAPMAEVTLPDPEFHHLFDAYSTAMGQARDLLRAPVVERLKSVYSVWNSHVHRSPMTRADGGGYFVIVVEDDRLYLARPMPRTFQELRVFEVAEQTEMLVQCAADVRLGLELIETVASRGVANRQT